METGIFSEFGIVGGSFILMLGTILYYAPKMFREHFEAIDRIQDKFGINLEKITDKNATIAEGFIAQLSDITKEHELQNRKLDEIHIDVKNLCSKKGKE